MTHDALHCLILELCPTFSEECPRAYILSTMHPNLMCIETTTMTVVETRHRNGANPWARIWP
jgi:hypothetical protein